MTLYKFEDLYRSTGTLHYSTGEVGYRLVLNIDQGLLDYYRSLIPKWYVVSRQRYGAHISVVRKETPKVLEHWGKYEGEKIEFFYSNDLQHDHQYWWLNCFSKDLEKIRKELGLPVSSPYTLPPDGFVKCFHSTVGNTKQML